MLSSFFDDRRIALNLLGRNCVVCYIFSHAFSSRKRFLLLGPEEEQARFRNDRLNMIRRTPL